VDISENIAKQVVKFHRFSPNFDNLSLH